VRTLFLFTVCPPMSGTLFFFRAEMFGLLKDKIPLVCWSQGSGYSLSVSIGSLYGVRGQTLFLAENSEIPIFAIS